MKNLVSLIDAEMAESMPDVTISFTFGLEFTSEAISYPSFNDYQDMSSMM